MSEALSGCMPRNSIDLAATLEALMRDLYGGKDGGIPRNSIGKIKDHFSDRDCDRQSFRICRVSGSRSFLPRKPLAQRVPGI